MQATADFRQEKHELDTILASGILSRAPNLAQLLTYVCTKYFEGAGSQIKEYNIAVEALGRPADFDQKKDSIVRVEAHRLRKRLQQYYSQAGADHLVQIAIPPGNYVPQFLAKSSDPVELDILGENGRALANEPSHSTSVQLVIPADEQPLSPVSVVPRSLWPRFLTMAAVLAVVTFATFLLVKSRKEA